MRPQSDLNVTPMIDVLLVLLVIFMAALPPEVRDKTLFVMGAGTLRSGEIITVIDAARGAGVGRDGVITERMRGK